MSAASNSKITIRVVVFCSLFCFILRNLLITNLLYTLVNTLLYDFIGAIFKYVSLHVVEMNILQTKLSSQFNVKVHSL